MVQEQQDQSELLGSERLGGATRTIVFVLIVITHRTGQRQLDSLRTADTKKVS